MNQANQVSKTQVLPDPMLARSGRLPNRDAYAYEPKWDGAHSSTPASSFASAAGAAGTWEWAAWVASGYRKMYQPRSIRHFGFVFVLLFSAFTLTIALLATHGVCPDGTGETSGRAWTAWNGIPALRNRVSVALQDGEPGRPGSPRAPLSSSC